MTLKFLSEKCPAGVDPNEWAAELVARAEILRTCPMAAPIFPMQVLDDLTFADRLMPNPATVIEQIGNDND